MKRIFYILLLIMMLCGDAFATVATSTSRIQYDCNGSVTQFAFTFGVNETSEVKVVYTTSAGTETTLTETTNYSVSCTNNDCSSGGTVTTVSTYASGTTITVLRNVPLTQESDFTEGMATLYETFEDGLDKNIRIDQQQQEEINRSPKLAKASSYAGNIYTFPDPQSGRVIGWNSDADDLTSYAINGDSVDVVSIANIGDYGNNIATAVSSIGSAEKTIVIDTTVSGDAIVPSNIQLWFVEGGQLSGTVTIYSPANIIAQPNQQIFTGDGNIIFTASSGGKNVFLDWWGPNADDATDDASIISAALLAASTAKAHLIMNNGNYYVADPGITISVNDAYIEGIGTVNIRCERTSYTDEGGGVYTVGQGNIFNADTITNITLKNITIKGNYDTSWGYQNPYANNVAAGEGSNIIFFHDCINVTLDNVKIKNSYSSYVELTTTHAAQMEEVYGWNQILLSGCTNVKLKDCAWEDSTGEAWLIYNCDQVEVVNSRFDLDYCTSQLDIIYCTHVKVIGCSFLRNLQSDAGDLLNVTSAYAKITNNDFLNGGCDIGNEYLNRAIPLGQTFTVEDIIVSLNDIVNGYITVATTDDTFSSSWAHENVKISNNNITIDLDTRPAANGSTVLNYTAIRLPYNHNSRNISVNDNDIIVKGSLQGSTTYDRLRVINGLMETTGYTLENYNIINNHLKCDITSYDPDELNNISGFIVLQYGSYDGLYIKGNTWDCPASGILIRNHEDLTMVTIEGNEGYSENFLNIPYVEETTNITDFNLINNRFIFNEVATHTYAASADMETKGAGRFCNIVVETTTDIVRLNIENNKVQSPTFVYVSNAQVSDTVEVDVLVKNNDVIFTDYTLSSGTVYPLLMGRANTDNDYSKFRILDNYFIESSAGSIALSWTEWKALDFRRNQLLGDFTISFATDDVSGESDSRYIYDDNLVIDGTITLTTTNATTAVNQNTSETITTDAQNLKTIGETILNTTVGAIGGTLPDGMIHGQRKIIYMTVDNGNYTLTVTSHETSDPEIFTFGDVGDFLELEWNRYKAYWITIKNIGVALP